MNLLVTVTTAGVAGAICDALKFDPEWTVMVLQPSTRQAVRHALLRGDFKIVVAVGAFLHAWASNSPATTRIAFLDDAIGQIWWATTGGFTSVIGTGVMTDPVYVRAMQTFWPVGSSFRLGYVPHSAPDFDVPFRAGASRAPTIIFPSRVFRAAIYTLRHKWRAFLRRTAVGTHVRLYPKGATGKAFIEELGLHAGCLVVIPRQGYVVRKVFETMLSGAVCLVSFPDTDMGGVAKRELERLGVKDGVHYISVTFETAPRVFEDVIAGRHRDVAEAAYTEVTARHLHRHRVQAFYDAVAAVTM